MLEVKVLELGSLCLCKGIKLETLWVRMPFRARFEVGLKYLNE